MIFGLYTRLMNFLMKDRSHWRKESCHTGTDTLWFHAASAGELEILIPIVEEAVRVGRKACVSIFSSSAEAWLKKLPSELLYRGFSPLESEWLPVMKHFGVSEVITSKYEAWPGMWRAASRANVRITVVCAQMRSSLIWAKRALKWMDVQLPKLRFFALEKKSVEELKSSFPSSECILSADPRWLRVVRRAESASSHASFQKWRDQYLHCRKPYWVIGSAWEEDMRILKDAIESYPGTVWVVPHSLKEPPRRDVFAPFSNCILVDEMGLLVELYSIADRAWVGGGFGAGIHSTLEPAVYSIPVACGPNQVEKFFEAGELVQEGLLTICKSRENVRQWLDTPSQNTHFSLKLKMEVIQQMIGSIVTS